jgi:ABC-type multidrug transport system fused ATPase/permease subunit
MKELLLKRRGRFMIYVLASFLPVVNDLIRMGVIALLFESIDRLDRDFFIMVIIISLSSVVVTFSLQIISRFLRISYMRDTILDVRETAFSRIIHTPYKQFRKKSKEVYISNLVNDINTFEKDFFINLLNFIFQGGMYTFSLLILVFLDPILALAIFVISVLIFLLSKTFEKRTVSLQQDVSSENEVFTVKMANVFNGLEILKLNNMDQKFLGHSVDAIDKVERNKFRFRVFSESQRNLTQSIGFGIQTLLLLYLLFQVQNGLSYGTLTFLLQLAGSAVFSLAHILPRLNVIKSSQAIYDKITKRDEEENLSGSKHKEFSFNERIQVEHLNFSYEDKEVLKDASFKIEKGKKYLIKGPSGAGKSTLMKLLSMTYDDYEGTISVDGINLKEINDSSFNNQVAFIYQDVFLFEDTIRNNITLYKDYDEEQIQKAIKQSGLSEFIDARPLGLDDVINENGKNLSGGERQRISIARAILKDAEILFIDEGTSALNEELGQAVEETFLSLERTVIAISHRYYKGATEKYDQVLEIKNGKIHTYETENYFGEVMYV